MASALREHHVVVVGAGIGGLVCALRLANQGLAVTVLERADAPGGKIRQVSVHGAAIDAGPTVFTMRWVFDQIFASVNTTLQAHVKLAPLSVLARHAWQGDQRLDLFADAQQSADAIGQFSGAAEAQRFRRFCAQAKRVYESLEGPYIRSAQPSVQRLIRDLGPRGLMTLAGLGPFASLWQHLSRQFADPRLQQLFGRYATYTGSSPWAAPATLILIAQAELNGVCAIEGGMHALARAVEQLARARGAMFEYGQHVEQIIVQRGRAVGVQLAGGRVVNADAVVYNGDAGALAAGVLGPSVNSAVEQLPRAARSLSALTWAVHAKTHGFELTRHNVFFQDTYASEFQDIFAGARLPRRPTVYVCAQDRGAVHGGHTGTERLLCLVNAPARGDQGEFSDEEIAQCEQASFNLLERCGLKVDRQAHNTIRTTPAQFHQLFPGTGGALYGRALRGWMDSFRRPGAVTRLAGLYLAGGGAHPGPGVPMAAMSGQLAAEALMAHLDSTSRSRQAATSGGTSTRSAIAGGTG